MKIRTAVAAALVLAIGACAAPAKQAPKKPEGEKKSDAPVVKVLYTFFGSDKSVEFVAKIVNPSDRTRIGVETTWKAFDSDGIIVSSFTSKRPPIPPHGFIYYTGHAGDASSVAESVKVTLSRKGTLTQKPPRPAVKLVGEPTLTRADYDFTEGAHSYDVTAVVEALSDVAGADVTAWAVLFDDAGNIVGAGWAGGPGLPGFGQDLPKQIAKGERVRVAIDAKAQEGGTPTKVEVFAAD